MLIDTHCHIHESGFYTDDREEVYKRAIESGVKMICIGTTEESSHEAVEFAKNHEDVWATVGVHPHDIRDGWAKIGELLSTHTPARVAGPESSDLRTDSTGISDDGSGRQKLVGIGEIGLDYFYDNSPRQTQIKALEEQLQWARDYNLPVSFHVREAYGDFWPILANFPGIRGVLHSFTDSIENMEKAVSSGLFIGVNGISTFARDKQEMFDAIPLDKMLLETDAPFLTPVPLRGKINEPAFVRHVAEYHAKRRGVELEHLARVTSANASRLFEI